MSPPVTYYCGPAAVASALGISRTEAAERLLKYQPRSRGWFNWFTVAQALGMGDAIDHPHTSMYENR